VVPAWAQACEQKQMDTMHYSISRYDRFLIIQQRSGMEFVSVLNSWIYMITL